MTPERDHETAYQTDCRADIDIDLYDCKTCCPKCGKLLVVEEAPCLEPTDKRKHTTWCLSCHERRVWIGDDPGCSRCEYVGKPDEPNPGSDEAITLGCTCPVMDNAYGRGAWGTRGTDAIFWKTDGCPVHTIKEGIDE